MINGKYSHYTEGYLGMDNSISGYDFSFSNKVKYFSSTSGSRSSNSYKTFEGKYKVEGDKLILNFGGSDRILTVSEDDNELTDQEGKVFKKD